MQVKQPCRCENVGKEAGAEQDYFLRLRRDVELMDGLGTAVNV